MILRDALLHFVHFLCIFSLASILVVEIVLFRQTIARDTLKQLQIVDRWYGIVAGLVVASGLALLFFGAKGSAFYSHNPVFWTKMALVAVVAGLSAMPTIAYIHMDKQTGPDGSVALGDAEYRRIRGFLWVQVGVFALIPLCATLMANGI
ncbi:MAG TPA: DUF2214 family protein [Candidatus Baltobacteraceae bacterium]|jgi:putative membrane protein|nr:DUF2214 family protein [Candidatus Baltobacteraceae bacterium]